MDNQLRDPAGRAKAAIIIVLFWLVADLANAASGLYAIWMLEDFGAISVSADYEQVDRLEMTGALAFLITFILSAIMVSRWIMQVNHNAQQWSNGVTISPGWNIGWFFVPIAGLFKPFEGVRQTWQASLEPDDPDSVPVPVFMRAWWGFFLGMNVVGNVSFRLNMNADTVQELITVRWVDAFSLLIDAPAAVLLIVLIRRLTAIQQNAISTGKFALIDQ